MVQHRRAGDKGAFVLLTFMKDPRWCSKSSHKVVTDNGATCELKQRHSETSNTNRQESVTASIGMGHE